MVCRLPIVSKEEDTTTLGFQTENVKYEAPRWVLASDFSQTELANLSPQQEHELHLKSLSHKDPTTIAMAINLEIITKSIGSEVFGFSADENQNRENNAIVKAAFDSFTKLPLQERFITAFGRSVKNAVASVNQTGSTISSALSLACSTMDSDLKNESIYTTLRDEYKKQSLTPPKKTYLYGIPKSIEDLKKAFAELSNDPLMKKFIVHFTYSFFLGPTYGVTRASILELANVPGKLESVQKIYDEAVAEVVPLVKNVNPDKINLNHSPIEFNKRELQPTLSEKLLSKIRSNPELSSVFEPIYKRVYDYFN
ncbi:hypothetical protein V9T40_001216 [Parthenolecanium corni]|uniref:Uncharacterized protein n=1 Tax=Parthenolecanium corni TaxID=536013 RepID=A0AAN9Y172_9HEMI